MPRIDPQLINLLESKVQPHKRGKCNDVVIRVPMIIEVSDSTWDPAILPDCSVTNRMFNMVTCEGSIRTLDALRHDPHVVAVEGARRGKLE